MKNIYRYELKLEPYQVLTLPIEKALTIQIQNERPYLWALIGDKLPEKNIEVFCFGTGTRDVDSNMGII